MTDIHCHILPDADDGAETMEDALSMARAAAASGVKTLLATPHCNLPGSVEKNYVSYDLRDRFVALCLAVRQAGIPLTILPGAEILCTPDLPELLLQKKLQAQGFNLSFFLIYIMIHDNRCIGGLYILPNQRLCSVFNGFFYHCAHFQQMRVEICKLLIKSVSHTFFSFNRIGR